MRFFADHCVPTSVLEALETEGHDIISLRDRLPTNAPDPEVMATAGRLDAILLSLNGDFSDLVRYPPQRHGGIVALQVKGHPEVLDQIVQRLIGYLNTHPGRDHYRGRLLLVEVHRIRVRGADAS